MFGLLNVLHANVANGMYFGYSSQMFSPDNGQRLYTMFSLYSLVIISCYSFDFYV